MKQSLKMATNFKTIYRQVSATHSQDSGYVRSLPDGKIFKNSKNSGKTFETAKLLAAGYEVFTLNHSFNMNGNNGLPNYNTNLPWAVLPGENPAGEQSLGRMETARPVTGSKKKFKLVLKNTHDSEQEFVIGDGMNLIGAKSQLDPLNGVVVVSGTFGASTVAILKSIAAGGGMDIHGIHIQSYFVNTTGAVANPSTGTPATILNTTDSDVFFLDGSIKHVVGNYVGDNPQDRLINLETLVNQSSQNTHVREDAEFRGAIDRLQGFVIKLPPFGGCTINFGVMSGVTGNFYEKV